jgi:hypothetical protein
VGDGVLLVAQSDHTVDLKGTKQNKTKQALTNIGNTGQKKEQRNGHQKFFLFFFFGTFWDKATTDLGKRSWKNDRRFLALKHCFLELGSQKKFSPQLSAELFNLSVVPFNFLAAKI